MPLANLKLLVRPNPGGLADHKRFLAEEAHRFGNSGRFSDCVISSEEGFHASCHLSLLVPHSPLLKDIIPPNSVETPFYQICLPVSTRTLKNLLKLLYTGDVSASKVEIKQIKTGLTLLGILDLASGCQSEDTLAEASKEPQPSLAVGVINSSQAKVAASALKLSVSQSTPTVELFTKVGEAESNVLRLHRIKKEDSNVLGLHRIEKEEAPNNNPNLNNNQEDVGRSRRRRRVRSYCEEEEEDSEAAPLTKVTDEIVLEGEPITQEVERCQDCGARLTSDWYRPPNRHDCQAMSETVCQYCGVTVRGSWYLPPSRHHCPGYGPGSTAPSRKRRKVSSSSGQTVSVSSPRTPRLSKAEPQDFSCPLIDCGRKCDSKKLLMLHLAISHYQEQMEGLYITGVCSDGGRVCPYCGDLQPGIKLNLLRHLAMEHEVVMELVDRDIFQRQSEHCKDEGGVDGRILGN